MALVGAFNGACCFEFFNVKIESKAYGVAEISLTSASNLLEIFWTRVLKSCQKRVKKRKMFDECMLGVRAQRFHDK